MENYQLMMFSNSDSYSSASDQATTTMMNDFMAAGGTGGAEDRFPTLAARSSGGEDFTSGSSKINYDALVAAASEAAPSAKKLGTEKKIKKHRYAFQTRSQVDILDDGYRWRKYGQKAVKNNFFPRSYYRCTFQGCGVKKQVQRLSKDEGVVVTTYEGIHSHPIHKPTDNFEHILSQMQIYTNAFSDISSS